MTLSPPEASSDTSESHNVTLAPLENPTGNEETVVTTKSASSSFPFEIRPLSGDAAPPHAISTHHHHSNVSLTHSLSEPHLPANSNNDFTQSAATLSHVHQNNNDTAPLEPAPLIVASTIPSEENSQSSVRNSNVSAESAPAALPSASAPSATTRKKRYRPVRKVWKRVTPFPQLSFEGAVLRDILAEERTYLAWVRTVLALLAIGLAIPKLLNGNITESDTSTAKNIVLKTIGTVFVLLGALSLLYSTYRFYIARNLVLKKRLIYDRYSAIAILVGGGIAILGCLVIIFL